MHLHISDIYVIKRQTTTNNTVYNHPVIYSCILCSCQTTNTWWSMVTISWQYDNPSTYDPLWCFGRVSNEILIWIKYLKNIFVLVSEFDGTQSRVIWSNTDYNISSIDEWSPFLTYISVQPKVNCTNYDYTVFHWYCANQIFVLVPVEQPWTLWLNSSRVATTIFVLKPNKVKRTCGNVYTSHLIGTRKSFFSMWWLLRWYESGNGRILNAICVIFTKVHKGSIVCISDCNKSCTWIYCDKFKSSSNNSLVWYKRNRFSVTRISFTYIHYIYIYIYCTFDWQKW